MSTNMDMEENYEMITGASLDKSRIHFVTYLRPCGHRGASDKTSEDKAEFHRPRPSGGGSRGTDNVSWGEREVRGAMPAPELPKVISRTEPDS